MDFPEELTFTVTEEDIAWGIRYSCLTCPIARAVSKAYPRYTVRVAGTVALSLPWTTTTKYYHSDEATAFQAKFDAGIVRVKPGEFTLKAKT